MTSIAVAGTGVAAQLHALAATANRVPIVAVATGQPSAKIAFVDRRTRRVGYDALPAGADVVVVATPPWRHADDALAALAAGAAVMVETPLATTLADADRLVAAPATRVAYAEHLAHSPLVTELLRMIPTLGPLTSIEVRSLQTAPAPSRLDPRWGGGALVDIGVHAVALAALAAAPAAIVAVTATMERGDHGLDDQATVTLELSSGLRARVEASWLGPPGGIVDLQVAGRDGVVRAELRPEARLEVNGDQRPVASGGRGDVAVLHRLGLVAQLRTFLDDLTTGAVPLTSAELGRHVLEVLCAAYASARLGNPVPLPFTGDRSLTPREHWMR